MIIRVDPVRVPTEPRAIEGAVHDPLPQPDRAVNVAVLAGVREEVVGIDSSTSSSSSGRSQRTRVSSSRKKVPAGKR